MTLGRLGPCHTSMMKSFAKIYNNFNLFTINTGYELKIC